ncbi:MAG TPA: MarR family transcriptional regulator [Armatimonadota bacterium]|nr:MarR family transcriptional regulator [Armatimonadota bacterium]
MNNLDPEAELSLGHWLKRAYLALAAQMNDLLRPHDLTYSQWQVLALVGRCAPEPATQRQIQSCLRVESATLTGVVDGLVRRGWLTRRENAADRRVNELTFTEAGAAIHAELAPWVTAQVQEQLQRDLSPGQVALAREVLQQVVRNLEPAGK